MIHLISTGLFLLSTCYSIAQENHLAIELMQPFQVEMIVFQHETKPDHQWWPPVKVDPFAQLINPPTITVNDIEQLNPTQVNQLTDSLKKLKQSHKYNVLFYSNWLQPVQTNPAIPPTLLKAGGKYGEHHELLGSVGLVADKELKLTLDFWWREFEPIRPKQRININPRFLVTAGPDQTEYQISRNFHLRQQQPLKPNQIYYVDSPVLGMLVLLTPSPKNK